MNNEEKILEMLAQMQTDITSVRSDITSMKTDITELKDTQSSMQVDMSQMQTTLTRVAVTQENIVIPQIKLLAEGHDLLLEKLARKERVEALEDDVALLKSVVKAMSQRISDLEKAQ